MTRTENGWPVLSPTSSLIAPFVVAGRSFPGGVRSGPVADVLRYVVANYHVRVESLYYGDVDKDDWGYSNRPPSNHASATAVDVNATTNPQGVEHSHTYAQEQTIRAILREAGGVVRWGRDFSNKPDPMHFDLEPGTTLTQIAAVAKKLRNPAWFKRDLKAGMTGDDVKMVQRRLRVRITGKMDSTTVYAVNMFRRRLGFAENGLVNRDLAYYLGSPA